MMVDPKKYVVGADATIADIDLEETEVQVDGERLTDDRAERIVEQTLTEIRRRNLVPGGKSLSGGRQHSPTVQFRVPEELRTKLDERADAEGISASKLARIALERYLTDRESA